MLFLFNMVRQHIIPQFYLKQFASKAKRSKTYKIKAYNKEKGKEIYPSLKNIGLEKYFYDKYDPPIFEIVLSFLEYYASRVYHKILKNKSVEILTDKERTIFSHFIFTQYTRTKAARELFNQVHTLIYEDLIRTKDFPKKEEFAGGFSSFLEDRAYLGQLKIMFDPNNDTNKLMRIPTKSSQHIFSLNWELLINNNEFEFYTSDHPVFLYEPESDGKTIKGYGIYAFQTPKVEMYFPLSPRLCLAMVGKESVKFSSGSDNNIEFEELEWINRQIIAEAYQFIFSKNNTFDYVKRILDLCPELKKIDRNRIYV